MSRGLPLVALLLVLRALPLHAQAPEDAVSSRPVDGWIREGSYYVHPSWKPLLVSARELFDRLADAAQLEEDRPKPELLPLSLVWNGGYDTSDGTLFYTRGILLTLKDGNSVALAFFGHEIGHAVQKRRGYSSYSHPGRDFTPRQYEAEADALGLQLAVKAGFSADAYLEGMRQISGHTCAIPKVDGDPRHPSLQDRLINLAALRRSLGQERLKAMLNGTGVDDAALSVDAFEPDGQIRPSRLLAATARRRAVELVKSAQASLDAPESAAHAAIDEKRENFRARLGGEVPPPLQRYFDLRLGVVVDSTLDRRVGLSAIGRAIRNACDLPGEKDSRLAPALARLQRLLADETAFLREPSAPR